MPPKTVPAAEPIIARIRRLTVDRSTPLLVAIDGPSGAGKSTIANAVAAAVGCVVVPGDDFFAAAITDAGWNERNAAERARDVIDWRRLRSEALEPLIVGQSARWHAFDFEAGPRADGAYRMSETWVQRESAAVIVLDGAYSSRPELGDLIDLSVFVDAPAHVRRARLAGREQPDFLDAWHARWDQAEAHFFTHVRPRAAFDLVVAG